MRIHFYRTQLKNFEPAYDEFLASSQLPLADTYYELKEQRQYHKPMLIGLLSTEDELGNVLLVEQFKTLMRLTANDWACFQESFAKLQWRLVCLDLPSTWQLATDKQITRAQQAQQEALLEVLSTSVRLPSQLQRKRQREGVARAQSQGLYRGRQQTPLMTQKCMQARDLITEQLISVDAAAKQFGIGRATLYRYLKQHPIS